MEIIEIIYNSDFLLLFATFIALMMLLMVVINVYDYYKITKPFNDIEKKYKDKRSL
jgi:hypothetical protein